MLAVTAGTFLLVAWVAAKRLFFFPMELLINEAVDTLTDRAF
jgi:hypothetical protein